MHWEAISFSEHNYFLFNPRSLSKYRVSRNKSTFLEEKRFPPPLVPPCFVNISPMEAKWNLRSKVTMWVKSQMASCLSPASFKGLLQKQQTLERTDALTTPPSSGQTLETHNYCSLDASGKVRKGFVL